MPLNIQDIHLLDNPLLDVFRSLKTTNFARDAGLFVAEGPTVVERVLRSGFSIHSLLVSDRKWQWFHDETEKGLLSAAKGIHTFPVGALIRIAAAFGAAGVIFGPGSADPFSRRVLRVSMGNVLFLPVLDSSDLTSTLTVLKTKHDFRICATSLNLAARTLSTYHFHPRTVLVFGNEYDGISAETSAISDVSLTIPMLNGTDSLNVSVSAGICAYQYRIQHGVPQLSGSFTDRPVREA
jgi:tRNA G18 (ribose-2'-O)-methylase SpoU